MGSKINGRGRVVSIIYSLSLDDNNIAPPLRAAVLYIDTLSNLIIIMITM